MKNVTVIGAGSWGCALGRILADNKYNVLLYDIDQKTVNEINEFHTNSNKLFNALLPDNVKATSDIKEAISYSEIIVLVVPTAVVRGVLKQINLVINYLLMHQKVWNQKHLKEYQKLFLKKLKISI